VAQNVVLLIGTKKGSFVFKSDQSRKTWSIEGPYHTGLEVFHLVYDHRTQGTLFAAVNSPMWGPKIQISEDLGKTWVLPEESPSFQEGDSITLNNLWHIEPGRINEPNIVYAGADPASLFKSEDSGQTWHEVKGLQQHSSRDKWQPGFGGLCLHSIVLDPENVARMWVGISAVGVFGTEDGGHSWRAMNQGVRADFLPDPFPKYGQCVHKLLSHPAKPNTLVQQNHCGVYRSDSGGVDWEDISESLPSRFGFPLAINSQDPDVYYVLPEDEATKTTVGGGKRFVSHAKFCVYRTRNSGQSWESLTNGLPQQHAYLHVLREGMASDSLDPCGIYIGTTTGQVFYSRDNGDHWDLLVDYLPPINSVECAFI
jgi:photosystem II stability/assembly factor-like uncharacterized protein